MIIDEKNQEEFGYTFESAGCHMPIWCKCDYCGNLCLKKKNDLKYARKTTPKDCCKNKNCVVQKREESILSKYGVKNASHAEEFKLKKEKTTFKNYGVKNPFQSEIIKDKIKETCLEKYGTEHPRHSPIIESKSKATCLDKYGCEYAFQADIVKNKIKKTLETKYENGHPLRDKSIKSKIKKTNLKKYGVEYPSQNVEIKNKMDNTCLEKYGVKNPFQSEVIKDKIKETCLEKYGVEYPAQCPEIQQKMKETCLEKYGFEHPFQCPEVQAKSRKTCLKNYGVEFPTQCLEIKLKVENSNLDKYGVKHSMQLHEFQEKAKKTCLEKYGVEYVAQCPEIQQKIKETCLEKYGVEYATQCPEVQAKIKETCLERYGFEFPFQCPEVQAKIKETCLERYGFEFPAQCLEVKRKILETKVEKYGTVNVNFGKTEKEIKEWINSFGFNFQSNYYILHGKELDMYDPELNIAIEYCGLFWHTELSLSSKDKNYHYDKYKKCLENKIHLITLFEDEWINKQEQCKNFISSLLKKFKTRIYARNCEFLQLNKKDLCNFYDLYHIQGKCNQIFTGFGLFYKNELVGCMSLGKHHRYNNGLVLNRLCFKDGVQIVGGASKLFSKCTTWAKENNYNKIISWSDNRWSLGNVYEKLGFKLEEELKPDYSYVYLKRPDKRFSKQSFKKSNKGIPKEQTELEWATAHGYARIWDCGKKRWGFELN